MSVSLNITTVGTYEKLFDYTTIPKVLPNTLNERACSMGKLDKGLDLSLGNNCLKPEYHMDQHRSCIDFLQKTSEKGSLFREVTGTEFISNRRILIEIATAPYNFFEKDVRIEAIRRKGVIFLVELDRNESFDNAQGHKFEQYMTNTKLGVPHDEEEDVSNAECVKGVFRAVLTNGSDSIAVMLAAELDAVDKAGHFVEIKTTKLPSWKWWQNQSLHHFIQATLANCPYIVYGHKQPGSDCVDFISKKITEDIPKNIPPRCKSQWRKEVCFAKLFDVLQQVKAKLPEDGDALVISIKKNDITLEKRNPDARSTLEHISLNHFA